MKRWVGCSFAKGHADYSPIIVLKLIFDTVIRAAYFLIFFFFEDFLENSGFRKGALT